MNMHVSTIFKYSLENEKDHSHQLDNTLLTSVSYCSIKND